MSEADAPAPGTTTFDSPVGLAIRRHCAPVLDLPPHAPPDDYLARRAELGGAESSRRLLRAAGLGTLLVDTGFHGDALLDPEQMARGVRRDGSRDRPAGVGGRAGGGERRRPVAVRRRLRRHARQRPSASAARSGSSRWRPTAPGFDLDPAPAEPGGGRGGGGDAGWHAAPTRLDDPVLARLLLWRGVDLGLPIQFHVGFGDSDIRLHRTRPGTAHRLAAPGARPGAGAAAALLPVHAPGRLPGARLPQRLPRRRADPDLRRADPAPPGRSSPRRWSSRRSPS